MAEGGTEYESDPEEAKFSLTMRRREASDDEEKEEEEDDDDCVDEGRTKPRRTVIVSEYESDGQGAVTDYDEEELEMEENDEYEERIGEAEGKDDGDVAVEAVVVEFESIQGEKGENEPVDGECYASHAAGERGEEDDKKENEPFSVPTAGAFYMHDDRFRDSAAGRHRRTSGGSKLWESKDDIKWGHDKFEEMTMQGRHYDEDKRGTRGHFRARGGSGREGNVYSLPNKSKAAYLRNSEQNATSNSNAPKSVIGRGPRRYLPSIANDGEDLTQNRRPGKSVEKMLYHSYTGRVRSSVVESNTFGSSLSFASAPFYPRGSSSNEGIRSTPKKYSQKPIGRNLPPGAVRQNVPDFISMDKLHIDAPFSRKPLNNMQLTQSRVVDQVAYQNMKTRNKVNFRASSPTQRSPSVEDQLLQQRPGSGSHIFSPPAGSVHSFKSEETEYLSETASVGKGNGSLQARLRASFPYHADQNISGTPAFLPLRQFGGQHHGGVGVPALGMAFPGYVAQQQHGLNNSEMTWLPVLAGAAEAALGATYRSSPPYPPANGPPASYHHVHSSSFSIPRKENVIGRPTGGLKSSQRSAELVNDGYGQRQNKPRRYTEMKFDQ